jgi:S1-C subfamily serine protease
MDDPISPPYADPYQPFWAPPDPATRRDAAAPPPPAPAPRPPQRRYRGRVTAVIVCLAVLLGLVAYATMGNSSSSTGAPPVGTRPPATATPPTTAPANGSNGNGSGSPANGSPPSVPRSPRTPRPTQPGAATPPTTQPGTGSSGTGNVGESASTTGLNVGVVDVNTSLAYQGSAAAGTGMILTANGEVLTNNHVVDGATSVTVVVVTTGKSYKADVVGTDPTADVALLQMRDASGLEVAKIGDSSKVKVGDQITAVGNAGGVGGAPSVNSGTVTALDQSITASDGAGGDSEQLTGLIQMNARLQPGDSGGPLYNAAGEVVGMNTAGSTRRRVAAGGNENFAIPINTAVDIAKQIESGTPTDTITIGTPGFLGIELDPNGTGPGVTIGAIVRGTPAEKLGLQEGDVITAVDGTSIDSPDTLSSVLGGHHGGDSVKLTWTDGGGQEHTESVTLVAGPAN